ncbi:MAG: RNA methyltransferase [Chitinophagaceae bacterium]|nr:RNA methyltransferase [Chitinophagaceae bacterium]
MQIPAALFQSLQNTKGFNKEAFKTVHESGEQVTSIRLNVAKTCNFQLSAFNFQLNRVPWSTNGYYLSERPSFTADPLFHAGTYYVQEASSMFLEEVLNQTVNLAMPLRLLDLCAAPGGKSTLIQSVINAESLLVSNEVIKTRVNILAENIAKWGAANVIVTNNDPKDFQRLENYFDVIVVDAPCSGSGLFRKDPAAINEWSEQNVQLCSQRQQRILADVLPSLKEDGVLIYSTCSYSEEEDEQVADWLIDEFKMENVPLKIEDQWGITETQSPKHSAFGYRFYPDKVKGEGFFIAAFRKFKTENGQWKMGRQKNKPERLNAKEVEIVRPYLKDADVFFFIKQKEEVLAVPMIFEADLAAIQNTLYIKKAGVKMGTVIRNELIPDHELAISTVVQRGLTSVEVEREIALQYLRRQDLSISTPVKGWALITHQQQPLGWAKILPNRINNYYPKEWRILNK